MSRDVEPNAAMDDKVSAAESPRAYVRHTVIANPGTRPTFATILSILGLLACLAMFLAIGGLLVYGSDRGLDLTDEIFYLIWARDPNAYALIYQPFGYLLHPLFELCRGNLQAYRLTGFAIAAGAGALLGYSLFPSRQRGRSAIYGAGSALTIFFPWIITPSYNSAANVGAMMAVAGIVTIRTSSSHRRLGGTLASAAGLCMSAFAKPPLCAILAGVMLMLAVLSRNARVRVYLLASLALGAALTTLFIAPWDMLPLFRRIVVTQDVLKLPNSALGLPVKIARDWLIVPPLLTLAAIAAAIGLALPLRASPKWWGYAAALLSAVYILSITPEAIEGSTPDFLGLALSAAAAGYFGVRRDDPTLPRLPIALLLAAPAAVALGTFNNQWAQMTYSMAFPFLALFALGSTDPAAWRRGIVLGFALIGPLAVMLFAAFYPYSLQDSLFEQRTLVEHPITHDPVRVDEDTAAFVDSADNQAKGALIVDLSGTGPGVAAVLGAKAPVLPWLNPATESWPDVVWSKLSLKERQRAWFAGPVIPLFRQSAPAKWLASNQSKYCRLELSPMIFWDKERTIEVWRPCTNGEEPGDHSLEARP